MVRRGLDDKIFDAVNTIIMLVVLVVVLYPLYFVIIASISEPYEVVRGNVVLLPRGFTIESYQHVLRNSDVWIGYRNSLFYTVSGTALSLVLTITSAYALSKKKLPGRFFLTWVFLFIMYFNGGLIPTYMLVRSIGLLNHRLTLTILGAFSVWNFIVTRTYFQTSIPEEICESAEIDGANVWQCVFKITFPQLKSTVIILLLLALGGMFRGDFGMFYQLVGSNAILLNTTDIIDTFIFRSLRSTADMGMTAAAGVFQSVLCFITVLTANYVVKKIDPDYSLF